MGSMSETSFPGMPPQQQPDGQTNKREALLYLIAGAVISAVIIAFVSYRTSRQPEEISGMPSYVRNMMDQVTAPPADKVFPAAIMNRLFAGDGLEIPFRVTFRGQEEWNAKLTIPKQRMTLFASYRKRQNLVRAKIAEFSELARNWAGYRDTLVYEIHLDNTDGISPSLDRMVRRQVEELDIRRALKLGHGVEFWVFRLSNEFRLKDDHVTIAKGAGETAYSEVESMLRNMLADNTPKSRTSLASGIFNSLNKNEGKKNRTVLVFSDGIEYSALADFYKHPPQPAEFPELWNRLQEKIPCPDVKGLTIIWKGFKTDASEDQILAAQRFWTYGFSTVGKAGMKMEY